MPLSSLRDPAELSRAQAVLDGAWAEIQRRGFKGSSSGEQERAQLAYVVLASLHDTGNDDVLIEAVVSRFLEKMAQDDGLRGKA